MDELAQGLIDFIKTASPLVWETLIKQVYVEAIANLLWFAGLAIGAFSTFKAAKYAMNKAEEDRYSMWDFGSVCLYITTAVLALISFGLLTSAVTHFINPEFYAIRYIIHTLK